MLTLDEYSEEALLAELAARRAKRADGKCDYCGRELGSRWRQLDYSKIAPGQRRPELTEENSRLDCCKFPERHDASPPQPEPAPDLTFKAFSEAQLSRAARWHEDDLEPWSGADWSGAMMGEVGEVAEEVVALFLLAKLTEASGHGADTVKKLRRSETGALNIDPEFDVLREKLANELADVFAYLCNLAHHYEIDLAEAVRAKFNEVSEKYDFPERL